MIPFVIFLVIVYLGVTGDGVGWFWWLVAGLALVTSFTRENRLWPAIRRWARSQEVRREDDPSNLSGRAFEEWTAEHLEREGYEAEVVGGGPGDGGADVIAERPGRRVAVQCKRISSSLGTEAVQDAVTAREADGAEEGWVVTTAPEVTDQAEDLARKTGIEVHLV